MSRSSIRDSESQLSIDLAHRMNIPKIEPGKKPPPIRTQARAATILPNFVGLRFQIHNGQVYYEVQVTEDMVGHKLGEFAPYVLLDCLMSTEPSN